jgi:hypothetical protein
MPGSAAGHPAGHPAGMRATPQPCEHLTEIHPVMPTGTECPDCPADSPSGGLLWLCLSCGWVACAPDAPHAHARAHYEETNHPIAAALGPGPLRRWCHVHQRPV